MNANWPNSVRDASEDVPEPEITVDVTLYKKLAHTCDPALGARNLRRTVEGVFQGIWLNKYAEREPRPDFVEFSGMDFGADARV